MDFTDESTELWRHPINEYFVYPFAHTRNAAMNDPEDVGSEYYLRDLMNSFLRATDSIYKSLASCRIEYSSLNFTSFSCNGRSTNP